MFRRTIEEMNDIFDNAETLNCWNCLEGCLSCLTGYTLHYCLKTHYERVSSARHITHTHTHVHGVCVSVCAEGPMCYTHICIHPS